MVFYETENIDLMSIFYTIPNSFIMFYVYEQLPLAFPLVSVPIFLSFGQDHIPNHTKYKNTWESREIVEFYIK